MNGDRSFWSEIFSALLSGGIFIASVVFYFKGEYLQAIYFILLAIALMLGRYFNSKQV